MLETCDHCRQTVTPSSSGGWWVGADGTSDCPADPGGHTVEGEQR